jgi:hypothetical protein
MALDVEGVLGCRMHGEKSLRALETLHLAFSSPGRLTRILRALQTWREAVAAA